MGLTKEQKARRVEQKLSHAVETFMLRFDCVPGVLFERLAQLTGDTDSVLTLIGDSSHVCPHCGEEIEKGDLVNADDEDEGHAWRCESCGRDHEIEDLPWETAPLQGPTYGGWPAAHSTVFWTDWEQAAQLAPKAGFLVYESPDFNGWILAVDGGGYSFKDTHWTKLYHLLGLEWHK